MDDFQFKRDPVKPISCIRIKVIIIIIIIIIVIIITALIGYVNER